MLFLFTTTEGLLSVSPRMESDPMRLLLLSGDDDRVNHIMNVRARHGYRHERLVPGVHDTDDFNEKIANVKKWVDWATQNEPAVNVHVHDVIEAIKRSK